MTGVLIVEEMTMLLWQHVLHYLCRLKRPWTAEESIFARKQEFSTQISISLIRYIQASAQALSARSPGSLAL